MNDRFNYDKFIATLQAIEDQGVEILGPRVLILRDDSDEKTKGGLHIPDVAQKRKKAGTIVGLGPGYYAVAAEEFVEGLTVGKRVTFNAYDGVEQTLDTKEGDVVLLSMHAGQVYMSWPNPHLKVKE